MVLTLVTIGIPPGNLRPSTWIPVEADTGGVMGSSPVDLVVELRLAGCVYAEEEAALLCAATHVPEDLRALVRRRLAGEPLEYVLGWAEFDHLRIGLLSGVFVPRRRTEFMVTKAATRCHPGDTVLDLCCGSGAVGIALTKHVDAIELYAADIDPVAVRCAAGNFADFGASGQVLVGDLYSALPNELRRKLNLVVANAPYVPTDSIALMPPEARLYEPRAALDGGIDGLDLHRRIIDQTPYWLVDHGHLIMECSGRQAVPLVDLLRRRGFAARSYTDPVGGATVVVGQFDPETSTLSSSLDTHHIE